MIHRILFVCTGNICRSPTAAGVFRHKARAAGLTDIFSADSAATHDYHTGAPPDPRAVAAARARGIALDDLRARPLRREDFKDFDLILAMDEGHLAHIARMAERAGQAVQNPQTPQNPDGKQASFGLFMDYVPAVYTPAGGGRNVPDPYYGGAADFEYVLDLVERGVDGLLTRLRQEK